ncbi:MAG: PhzF family phenazine biosynthesis protein [Olegusella sp.]|nr:PhzF family phenazine biosynthesis protein [Olegusella sp.]
MKQYVVDAFTDKVFAGNQAAVCVLDAWPAESLMMSIAAENNFSETAFVVHESDAPAGCYHLRWFTPGGEIDLCGHATLATAYVLLRFYKPDAERVEFDTLGGHLVVERSGDLLAMDFPAYELTSVPVTDAMEEAVGVRPLAAYMGRDLLCVLPSAAAVRDAVPDQDKVRELDGLLLHITACGGRDEPYDCVSRSFAPKLAVAEDPVCGSGHCHIVPYWARELGKDDLFAYQASHRGGELRCQMRGDRVMLAGHAALYSVADLFV